MSNIKNGGLDQYGDEPFKQQQFETAGVEGVNSTGRVAGRTCDLLKQETHQEMRYSTVTSLYFATPLAFNADDEGVLLGRSL